MKTIISVCFTVILMTGCASRQPVNEIEVVQLIKSTTSWNGQVLSAYQTSAPEITILRITIPPHHALPMHTHPVINAGVLLKGTLTVVTNTGETLRLKPNDPIVEVVNTWHYGKNEGDEPAEIIVFYIGEKGQPITIKQSAK